MCGEKDSLAISGDSYIGSPPRVRGKDSMSFDNIINARITPACAGKSASVKLILYTMQDHPRVCGEKRRRARMNCTE